MERDEKLSARLRVSVTVAVPALALALACPAVAQEGDPPPDQVNADEADDAAYLSTVVVTGSYIRGSAEDAALPVDVIGGEEIALRGTPSTLELIKALSSSSGVLGDTNQYDSRSSGSEGSGSINLRGLGPERTLVLLNGRRMAINPVPSTSGGVVDTNLIPSAALARVEVLKDGAAALYGSDAISGVVNFITRTDQRGFSVGGDYKFVNGSDGDWNGSLSWGGQLGNLNLFLSSGYQHRSRLGAYEREFVRKTYLENPNGGYTAIGNPGAYVPLGPDYAPLGTPRRDVNCESLNGFAGLRGTTPVCYSQSVQFGDLVHDEDRYQLFGNAEWEASDSTTLYLEGLFVQTEVNYLTGGSQAPVQLPSIEATGISALTGRFYVPAENPGFASYVAANPGVFPDGTTGVQLVAWRPFFLGGNPLYSTTGGSESGHDIKAYRISGGIRGSFWGDVDFDVGATYMNDLSHRTIGDVLANRLQLALIGLGGPDCDADPSTPGIQGAPGVNGCQYFNPFSTAVAGNPAQGGRNPQYNPAVANDRDLIGWFYQQSGLRSQSELFVMDAVLNGGSGIHLPGGEIQWALGTQYRWSSYDNRAESSLADAIKSPCLATPDFFIMDCEIRNGPWSFFNVTTPANLSGDVYAIFSEVSLPLFDNLSLQAAARYEDYGSGTGSTFNPKLAGKWEPLDWLSLRSSVSTTFRGPPLIATDPNPSTTLQNVRGIYRAVDNYGDPNLKPETATTYNLGILIDHGGFRASADYWAFKLRDVVTTEPVGALASVLYPTNTTNRCTDPAYAAIVNRFTFQDLNGNGTEDDCAAGNIARVRVDTINSGAVDTDGLDLSLSYTFDDLAGMEVVFGGDATWTRNFDASEVHSGDILIAPAFDGVGKLNFQTVAWPLPEWKGNVYANLKRGAQNLRLSVRYIDSYTDQRTSIFLPSVNYGTDGTLVAMPQGKNIPSWTVVDLAYRLAMPDDLDLTVAVENIFDRDPPFVRLNYSYDPFTANGLGATVKIGLSKKF